MNVYREFKRDLRSVSLFSIVFYFGWLLLPLGRDATDPPYGRSHMALRIDNETGLHYLEGRGGVLTPRLDKGGSHMCNRDSKNK